MTPSAKGLGLGTVRLLHWVRANPCTPVGMIHNGRTVAKALEHGVVEERGPGLFLTTLGNKLLDEVINGV